MKTVMIKVLKDVTATEFRCLLCRALSQVEGLLQSPPNGWAALVQFKGGAQERFDVCPSCVTQLKLGPGR